MENPASRIPRRFTQDVANLNRIPAHVARCVNTHMYADTEPESERFVAVVTIEVSSPRVQKNADIQVGFLTLCRPISLADLTCYRLGQYVTVSH